ncbi:MAG: glycosyltransferase family 9 protein [Nanoarchaeota archaeon]|nr:glycosyltransferase family 9 protein [Nanoarchaeota archaeon]
MSWEISMTYSILIIKTGALGDVLRSTTLLKQLKKKYKDPEIHWLTSERAKELLQNNEFINKIHTIENHKDLPEHFNLILSLDDDEESAVIASDIKNNKLIGTYISNGKVDYTKDSAEWFGMGLLRSEEKGGLEKANRLKKENKKNMHEILANISGLDYNYEEPILNLIKEEIDFRKEFAEKNSISESDLIIGLNTGAGKRWQLKRWPVEKTAELADMLIEKLSAKIILLGGKEEKDRNGQIKELTKNKLIDAGNNNTMRQFASIINLCRLVVTSDTLAMYISIALKKKVVVLIGPTSAAEIEIYGRGKKIYANLPCICCYKKKCEIKPNCMDLISVENVYKTTEEQLK